MNAMQEPDLPALLPSPLALPHFEVNLAPPDLQEWLEGNCGVAGLHHYDSGKAGPHVMITALMHGNEIAGAIALEAILRANTRPQRGSLTLGFLNLAAFERFDPAQPTTSRFVDEDMNRIWDRTILDGPRHSAELDRARELLCFIDSADILLDLHSMLWPSEALILSGPTAKGRKLARAIGTPSMTVADRGHSSGPRLIDYEKFADDRDARTACLIEAGPHWEPSTVATARVAIGALLRETGLDVTPPENPETGSYPRRCAEVTEVITAGTSNFSFVQPFRGGDLIATANTLIAHDGPKEIRTPYDHCLLVMPSLRPSRGHTAVRLARLLVS